MLGSASAVLLGRGTAERRLSGWASRTLCLLGSLSAVALAGGCATAGAEVVFTNYSVPTITGSAVEGEVLQEQHARWSSTPAGYAYEWQRCNSAGEHCASIKEATAQSYRLTAADVGFTIRVSENAQDSAGAVTPAVSEPTAVVQARAGGGGGGGGEQHGGGGQSGGGGGNPGAGETPRKGTHSHPRRATLRALLLRQLTPSGDGRSRSALLRRDGLSLRVDLPVGGTLTVHWYLLPAAGRGKSSGRPALVASGRARIRAARAGTIEIRLTARGRALLGRAHGAHLRVRCALAAKGATKVDASSSFSLRG